MWQILNALADTDVEIEHRSAGMSFHILKDMKDESRRLRMTAISIVGVILSGAAFQAERGISREAQVSGFERARL